MAPTPTWETVLERNTVERIKLDKPPLGIRDELPALIAGGYEALPEEDIVRLQWWGLYHDKPKVGTFMLRVKIPNGVLTPAKLRTIGELSNGYGRGDAELTTRQCIQLHWLELSALPDVFADLEASGITSAGGCGDTVRNITGCPVSGIAADELFDSTPVVDGATDTYYGNPEWANLPRKHKYSIASCPDRCNAPEINCISLVGVLNDGREGYAVKVGGGLSSVPRIARDLGVFVPKEDAVEILGVTTSVWSEDLKYRMSRVKARMKFVVDDIGADGMLERVEAKLGRPLERFELPSIDVQPSAHLGVHAQKQEGLSYIGVPVQLGLTSGDQLIAVADLAESFGGDVRVTRQQNLIVTGVPNEQLDAVGAQLAELGLPLETNEIWANSIACSGSSSISRRRSATTWRSCASTSTAARTHARSTGSASLFSRRPPARTTRASASRPMTSSCAGRSGPRHRSAAPCSGASQAKSSSPRSKGSCAAGSRVATRTRASRRSSAGCRMTSLVSSPASCLRKSECERKWKREHVRAARR